MLIVTKYQSALQRHISLYKQVKNSYCYPRKKMFLKKIIFLLLAKSWAEKCPDGWDEFQGHCYMIGTNFYENAKLRTWHNAKVS